MPQLGRPHTSPSYQYAVRFPMRMRLALETIAERDGASVASTVRRLVATGIRIERGDRDVPTKLEQHDV